MKDNEQNSGTIDIRDFFAAQRKWRRKNARRKYLSDHWFEFMNLIVSVIALLISLLALFLPRT